MGLNTSRGIRLSRLRIASARPRSTTTLPYSTRFTMPEATSPTLSLYSSYWRSRSASRTRWTMTCFAVCVAILPNSTGGNSSLRNSPISASGLIFLASSKVNCVLSFSTSSTTSINRLRMVSPVFVSISARISFSAPYLALAAF